MSAPCDSSITWQRQLLVYSNLAFAVPAFALVTSRRAMLRHYSEVMFCLTRIVLAFASGFYHYCKPDADNANACDAVCAENFWALYQNDLLACVLALHFSVLLDCVPSGKLGMAYVLLVPVLAPFLTPYVAHSDDWDVPLAVCVGLGGLLLHLWPALACSRRAARASLWALVRRHSNAWWATYVVVAGGAGGMAFVLQYSTLTGGQYAVRHALWHFLLALVDCATPFLFVRGYSSSAQEAAPEAAPEAAQAEPEQEAAEAAAQSDAAYLETSKIVTGPALTGMVLARPKSQAVRFEAAESDASDASDSENELLRHNALTREDSQWFPGLATASKARF